MATAWTASASIVIDNFTDLLPAETHYTGSPGNETAEIRNGLEVGKVYTTLPLGTTPIRNSESASQTGLAGVLGGQRDSQLTLVVGGTSALRNGKATIGYGYMDTSTGGAKTTTLLQYGNVTALNADFSALAGGYFLLKDWYLDHGTVDATLTLISGASTQSKLISLPTAGGIDDVMIAFSEFSMISFSDVDVIKLQFANTDISQDFYLAGFSAAAAVPEPTTMIAGALLLLPFGASTLRMLRKNRTA